MNETRPCRQRWNRTHLPYVSCSPTQRAQAVREAVPIETQRTDSGAQCERTFVALVSRDACRASALRAIEGVRPYPCACFLLVFVPSKVERSNGRRRWVLGASMSIAMTALLRLGRVYSKRVAGSTKEARTCRIDKLLSLEDSRGTGNIGVPETTA